MPLSSLLIAPTWLTATSTTTLSLFLCTLFNQKEWLIFISLISLHLVLFTDKFNTIGIETRKEKEITLSSGFSAKEKEK